VVKFAVHKQLTVFWADKARMNELSSANKHILTALPLPYKSSPHNYTRSL